MTLNKILVALLLLLMATASFACAMSSPGGADPKPEENTSQSKYSPGDCFIRNGCMGNPLPVKMDSPEECVRKNGNSWVNDKAQCISDINQS